MKASDIVSTTLDIDSNKRNSISILEGEIEGATLYYHNILKNDKIEFSSSTDFIRVLFICSGSLVFESNDKKYIYEEKAFYTTHPSDSTDIFANENSSLLEIQWKLTKDDWKELGEKQIQFPITDKYFNSIQYRDYFKSDKTISRVMVPQRVLPRFAMGSVETHGEDLIGQHAHPLLDQYFFSFPENDMDLLIDDIVYPMKGNTLLHIPLGSNHGVKVGKDQCAHYIWIDFLVFEGAEDYLDEVHKETNENRKFVEGNAV